MNPQPRSPELSSLPESLQFLRLIWEFCAALEHSSEDMSERFGVTGRQRFILRVTGLTAGATTEHLAALLGVDAASIESDLQALVGKGFVTTQGNGLPAHHVTALGAKVNAASSGTVEHAVSKALDDATSFERAAFRRMLERMTPYLKGRR